MNYRIESSKLDRGGDEQWPLGLKRRKGFLPVFEE
jgi:hypothetical protein